MCGAVMPAAATIAAHPRYSTAAASEIVATRSNQATVARLRAKAPGMPPPAVSGTVRGTQS